METHEQCPWIEYLETDEDTDESYLRKDAPEHIRKAYQEYLDYVDYCTKNNILIAR